MCNISSFSLSIKISSHLYNIFDNDSFSLFNQFIIYVRPTLLPKVNQFIRLVIDWLFAILFCAISRRQFYSNANVEVDTKRRDTLKRLPKYKTENWQLKRFRANWNVLEAGENEDIVLINF